MSSSSKRRIFALDDRGYFTRDGRRIFPVGVNYWPATCGVEMWLAWPEEEIRRDLDLMVRLGFNCVRFFLRWQDFEPKSGRYDAAIFQRLDQFLGWCRERDLLAHPSLIVGWMSGGIFWPEWKQARNIYADADLRLRGVAFARKVARHCAEYRECLLALDLGNELCCLPDCLTCEPHQVRDWCEAMSGAIREGFPEVLVISGNEQNQIIADTGWQFDAQPGCDLLSMHTYPNCAWHSLAFDGMTDPLAQSLLPFYVKCARAFGPVFVQEFGTIFTIGACCDQYLRGILPAAWEAGANGFLWWSLRDFKATGHPYNKNAFEGPLGIAGPDDSVKPVLDYFKTFVESLDERTLPSLDAGEVAIYWPRHFHSRGDPLNPGNEPRSLSRRMIVAHFTLSELGYRVGVVRGDQPLTGLSAHTIVVPGAALTAEEVGALIEWVRGGGRLIWHGVDPTTWGEKASELAGAAPADFRALRGNNARLFGATWNFPDFPRDVALEVMVRAACVIAAAEDGRPLVLDHKLGLGAVAVCLPQIDETFAAHSDDRSARADWGCWYRGMLALVSAPGAADTAPFAKIHLA